MELEQRVDLILALGDKIAEEKDKLVEAAINDIGFTFKDISYEFALTISRLKNFQSAKKLMKDREPVCNKNEEVALILPYNGSSWLNIAIVSIFLAGNNVRVKFSSKSPRITGLVENIYSSTFGDAIKFDYRHGEEFMKYAITSPDVKAIIAFGSDSTILPYEPSIKNAKKKLVFEGPGNDPFIVLNDADVEAAVKELTFTKYMYSGQACTAPERIYVQEDVYGVFLDKFRERTKNLVVGDPANPNTDVCTLASRRAVENIQRELNDAVAKGAKLICGGKIDGRLVYPTIVADANHTMLGMRDEVFGPVSFVCKFSKADQAIALAGDSKYGLRAAIYGRKEAENVARMLRGASYLEEVEGYTFGKFGTLGVNEPRAETWRDALVTKPIGGYGYSGWVWDFETGRFRLRQGPKLFSIETSRSRAAVKEDARVNEALKVEAINGLIGCGYFGEENKKR